MAYSKIMTVSRTPPFSSLLPLHHLPLPFFSLSKLLDEDLEHSLVSEERDREQHDMIPTGAFEQQDSELQWTRNTRDQPEIMSMSDSAVQTIFSDLLSLPQTYRGRSKKGLSMGCFGVKLDRIGSLSGLGC
uniref:C-type natriuretic peptide n=1 Tax=Accipiter nisus TaxID=211598 RepID=A0A8B9M3R9_9AVES